MDRTKLIVANWKMNHTVPEALKFFAGLRRESHGVLNCEVVIAAPFTALYALEEGLKGTLYKLGAQNMHWEDHGPFTGEISPLFLTDLNVEYVLLGHSERRQYFGENDKSVNMKLVSALRHKIAPIVCVGETLEERKKNLTKVAIEKQIRGAVEGLLKIEVSNIVWAYEPRWAIGTGKNATAQEATEVIAWIRNLLTQIFNEGVAQTMRILYGGSVSADNAKDFVNQKEIDGLLVGGASLDPKTFAAILDAAE